MIKVRCPNCGRTIARLRNDDDDWTPEELASGEACDDAPCRRCEEQFA